MHGIGSKDGDRVIDWGRTAADYATWRPDYPPSFYERLQGGGVGLAGQRVLDLGTGVGFIARQLARQGCEVHASDIAGASVAEARRRAEAEGLAITWDVCPAEESGLADGAFDVITASQCFLYFDKARIIPEVHRLLAPGGVLVTCHLSWLPRLDAVARASEALILQHNPDWSAADWSGEVPELPGWAVGHFTRAGGFCYDQELTFSHEGWRGRIRASRGIGASLSPDEVAAFDREHAALLAGLAPDPFAVRHRIDAEVMAPCAPASVR